MELPLWPGKPPLWDDAHATGANANACTMQPYLLPESDGTRPAFVCLAGGGYAGRSLHEAHDIARWMNDLGLHAFVCNYRVIPCRWPAALLDAQRAMRVVRHRASEWRVDAERVGVIGFSAGGHLGATLSTKWDRPVEGAADEVDALDARPSLTVLGYSVVSFLHEYHGGSMRALLGDDHTTEMRELLSAERHVRPACPPAFIWTTADDHVVPASNTLKYFSALRAAGIPAEMHVFESGPHGLGLAPQHPECRAWPGLCAAWLARHGWR